MKLKVSNKTKISTKLLGFLNILKSSSEDLEEMVKDLEKENPFIDVKYKKFITFSNYVQNSNTEIIENNLIENKSLYENLKNQIETSNLFPTEKSKKIAFKIIEDITNEGFFEGKESVIAKELGVSIKDVKKVRQRFYMLDPAGVGAKDIKESFYFQLNNFDVDNELYNLLLEMIENLEHLEKFKKHKRFFDALGIIKQFKIVPAIQYIETEYIIPDIIILNNNNHLEVKINDEYYPTITIKKEAYLDQFAKEKIKEAKSLIEALELRKSTLYKIGLMILELQYEFFTDGIIKPMKLQDVADELGYTTSTISRAISNKYILSNRGLIPIKYFFSKAVDNKISNREIKNYIKYIIENEDKQNPLNDEKITNLVKEKFNLDIVRRTISKYREELNISTSRQRKKEYLLDYSTSTSTGSDSQSPCFVQ